MSEEIQSTARISELLSNSERRQVLEQFIADFDKQPGIDFILGITEDGKVLGIKIAKDGEDTYFNATFFNLRDDPKSLEISKITANISMNLVDYLLDGGTTIFPPFVDRSVFDKLKVVEDSELPAVFETTWSKRMIDKFGGEKVLINLHDIVHFYKKTGGFERPSPITHPRELPSVGGQKLYPLKEVIQNSGK